MEYVVEYGFEESETYTEFAHLTKKKARKKFLKVKKLSKSILNDLGYCQIVNDNADIFIMKLHDPQKTFFVSMHEEV